MGSFDPGERQFLYDEAFAFEAKRKSQTFIKKKKAFTVHRPLFATQDEKK